MPKQRRAAASRSIARPAAKKSSSKAPKALKLSKRAKVSKPSSKLKASKPSKSPKKDRLSARTAAAAGVRAIAPKEPTPTEVARSGAPSSPPGLLRSARGLRDGCPRAPAPRLRGGRRQPPRSDSGLSERTRARRTRPSLSAGLRARNRSPAVRAPNAVRVRLRRDCCAERRRRRWSPRAPEQGARESSRERSRPLYYGSCPSGQGRSLSRAGPSPTRSHVEPR